MAVRILSKRPVRLALALVAVLGVSLALVGPIPRPVGPSGQIMYLPAVTTSDTLNSPGRNEPPAIEGWITDRASNSAISGATVSLARGVQTISDERGYFSFIAEEAEQGSERISNGRGVVHLSVRAARYGDWDISQAAYYTGDTLRLYPRLETAGHSPVRVAAVQANYASADVQDDSTATFETLLLGAKSTSKSQSLHRVIPIAAGTSPATIRVYRTQQGTVEVVPFRDYLKHVLPLEWAPTWGQNALKAGAMAAKTYAWYWVNKGGKQVSLGADVKDNDEDQVYDPNVSYASTDAAVDATFDYVMTLNGSLFQAQYCAGSYAAYPDGDCPWPGAYMTQWGSAYHADNRRSWGWILQFYYPGAAISPDPPGGGYDGTPPPTDSPQPATATPIPPVAPPTAVPPTTVPATSADNSKNKVPAPPATGQASLQVRVQWLGRKQAPSDSWAQPLTLRLSAPGNPAVLGTYQGATDKNGVAFYQNLPAGKFDVHVKGPHSLQSARASIALTDDTTTSVDMKTLVEGDVDGDNCVTIDDFSLVQALLGTNKDTPGFDARADLNGDSVVTMDDFSLLRSGFERCGDISVDKEFAATQGSSPSTLAGALTPWINPAALQHTLALDVLPASPSVKVGGVIKMDVVAQAGTQSIDGASFVLKYDAQRFVPVDTAGNSAVGMEPGYVLPAVMGNWVDAKNGSMGFSSGVLQGSPHAGRIVLASMRFRALGSVGTGPALFYFATIPSPNMQITNGGDNLLAKANDLTISVVP